MTARKSTASLILVIALLPLTLTAQEMVVTPESLEPTQIYSPFVNRDYRARDGRTAPRLT